MATHGPGRGKTRINLAVDDTHADQLKTLADRSGLSLNAFINALLADALKTQPIIMMHTEIIRENRPKYGENHDQK